MSKDGGWLLPDVIDPDETVCIQFDVPNDPRYTQAFWGALWLLGEWFNWQRDPDHKAKDVAAVWRRQWMEAAQRWESGEGCEMSFDVRQDPGSPCTLQKSTDGGETWEDFADLRLCVPNLRWVNGRLQTSPNGIDWTDIPAGVNPTQPPTQPQPPVRGTPSPGQDNRCLAAANAANGLKMTYEAVRTELATTDNVATLALGAFTVLGFFLLFPPSAIVLIPLVTAMLALGDLASNPFTEDDLETLQCILFCAASDDGGVITFDIDEVKTALDEETGLPLLVTSLILDYIGASGLDWIGGTTAITSADCDDCGCPGEWCYVEEVAAEDWSIVNGTQVTGGVDSVNVAPNINRVMLTTSLTLEEGTTITQFVMNVATGGINVEMFLGVNGSYTVQPLATGGYVGDVTFNGEWTASGTYEMGVASQPGDPTLNNIRSITVRGTGVNPFSETNC